MFFFAEKVKSFLTEFYSDARGGGKEFKYGSQLVSFGALFL